MEELPSKKRWDLVGRPYLHHPHDRHRGGRQRQGCNGGSGDVVGVSSIYFGTGHAESDWNRSVWSLTQGGVGLGS
jgi:hypothetical protein